MRQIISLVLVSTILLSCHEKKQQPEAEAGGAFTTVEITEENTTPSVDISKYILITDSKTDRRADAREILQVKRKWPLAMQSKSKPAFDSILTSNFVFKGGTTFYNREDYINDRTLPHEWKITFVKYDNVTLQFFGNTAILSYANQVRNEHTGTGAIEIEHISWVDIFLKENDKWKIGAAHSIDYRVDTLTR